MTSFEEHLPFNPIEQTPVKNRVANFHGVMGKKGRKRYQQVRDENDSKELHNTLAHMISCPELVKEQQEYWDHYVKGEKNDFKLENTQYINLIIQATRRSTFLSGLGGIETMVKGMKLFKYKEGEVVVEIGHASHFFYICKTGQFQIKQPNEGQLQAGSIVNPGDFFGDISLVQAAARTVTVVTIAKGESSVLGIDRKTFRDLLREGAQAKLSENYRFLKNIPLFKDLNDEQIHRLASSLEVEQYKPDEKIMVEGEDGEHIYIIKQGQVMIYIGNKFIRQCEKGQFFGERALLYDEPRSATIVASNVVTCLTLSREVLELVIGNLHRVLSRNIIIHAMKCDGVFDNFPMDKFDQLVETMAIRQFPRMSDLINLNSIHDIRYFVVLEGEVEVTAVPVATPKYTDDSRKKSFKPLWNEEAKEGNRHKIISRGNSFGATYMKDPSLRWLHRARTTARFAETKVAFITASGLFCCLGNDNYDKVMEINYRKEVMKNMYIFQFVEQTRFDKLANAFQVETFRKGDYVLTAGEESNNDAEAKFYIVKDGEVEFVTGDGRHIRNAGALQFFGERALILDEPRSASVIIVSAECKLWCIRKNDFIDILSESPGMLEHLRERFKVQDFMLKFSDLRIVGICGKGGFGTVFRVAWRGQQKEFALKRISKRHLLEQNSHIHAIAETQIMRNLDHPLIIKQIQTWKDSTYLYILQELISGGELTNAIAYMWRELGGTRRLLKSAKFYIASIIVAVEYLHKQNVIWRDMKPENILLDRYGYIKLIDFGCAKKITANKTYTVCGTPTYCAPEVIQGSGYNKSCDIWSMGIILYELITGHLPFGLKNEDSDEESAEEEPNLAAIYGPIFSGRLEFPSHNPAEEGTEGYDKYFRDKDAEAMITGLLSRVPSMRSGCGYRGLAQLKKHPFLEGWDWDSLMSRSALVPYTAKDSYAADEYMGDNWRQELEEEEEATGNNLPPDHQFIEDVFEPMHGPYVPGWDDSFKCIEEEQRQQCLERGKKPLMKGAFTAKILSRDEDEVDSDDETQEDSETSSDVVSDSDISGSEDDEESS